MDPARAAALRPGASKKIIRSYPLHIMRTITLRYTSLLFSHLSALVYDLVLRFYLLRLVQRRGQLLARMHTLR